MPEGTPRTVNYTVENEQTSSDFKEIKGKSDESETTICQDPLDETTIISYLQHRLERADRLIAAIRQEQHESFVKVRLDEKSSHFEKLYSVPEYALRFTRCKRTF